VNGKKDEACYKSLDEEDFTSFLTLKLAIYLTENKVKPTHLSTFRVRLADTLKESLLKPLSQLYLAEFTLICDGAKVDTEKKPHEVGINENSQVLAVGALSDRVS
jgi:hypothetical protein